MINENKIMDIAQKLLAKSKKDQVVWNHASVDFEQAEPDLYYVQFPESCLKMGYIKPIAEPDKINIWIQNKENQVVADVYVSENEDDRRWIVLRDLLNEAERNVKGWDRTLNEIEKELQKEGSIGQLNQHEAF